MKQFLRSTLLVGVCLLASLSYSQSIAITEFLNESNGDEALGEWIELYNYGASPVNINNWTLRDEDTAAGGAATLPNVTIAPNDFVVLARDKQTFINHWFFGQDNPKVLTVTGTWPAMGANGDELVLRNSGGTIVWSLAYANDDTIGRSTFLTGTSFAQTTYGSKASPGIDRDGTDVGGALGYQSNDATADTAVYYTGVSDYGSPLKGHYGASSDTRHTIDLTATGEPFSRGVRGLAISDVTIERAITFEGLPDTLDASRGSSIRGVAGGLYADLYDWRTRVSSHHSAYTDVTQPRPTTLQFLRWARDYGSEPVVTANTRGLVEYDPVNANKVRYYTTDITTLADLAADWVRYTNHIVQTYRQGDLITDVNDQAILNSLVWSSAQHPNDTNDILLSPSEAAVPRVKYWEIGNEPTISTSNSIGVSNGYILDAEGYSERYKAIALAMKAVDPTIKVGPCVVDATGTNDAAIMTALASDPQIPIDFVSYHPYQTLGNRSGLEAQEYLAGVYAQQYNEWVDIRNILEAAGRDLDSIEMIASEVNVSNWPTNDTVKEGELQHALGSVETVFTFARLGLFAAHYWIWVTDQDFGTRYPSTMAYEKLRDYMGDVLVDVYTIDNRVRVYITRDSQTGHVAVWALNFSNDQTETVKLKLDHMSNETVRRLTLKSLAGTTSLQSANLSGFRAGGPRNEVDWMETSMDGTDLSQLDLVLEPATLTLLLSHKDTAVTDWSLYE